MSACSYTAEEQVETGGAQLHYFLPDATVLFLAWQIAETFSTSLNSAWNTRYNPLSPGQFCHQIGLIAAEGLYSSGKSAVIISGLLRL